MVRSLVVAVARNGVIGRDNRMPWHLPAELAHFKAVTMGHPVIMGRRTHESIGKVLPGRPNIVLTRSPGFEAPGCIVVNSLDKAWEAAGDASEACVIGGTTLFRDALPFADRIWLTRIEAAVEGDTFFPPMLESEWSETVVARHPADERHAYPFTILRLERRRA